MSENEKTKVSAKDLAEIYNMELIEDEKPKEETKPKDGYTEFENFSSKIDDEIEEKENAN